MEELMTGFKPSIEDSTIFTKQKEFESWSKLVSPLNSLGVENNNYSGEPFVYKSCSDGYLFLDVPTEECFRRVTGRKLDPTTGIIYHPEDNPVPEGDPKLKDRLQDYQGEPDQDRSRI
jgi:hypothetical protein